MYEAESMPAVGRASCKRGATGHQQSFNWKSFVGAATGIPTSAQDILGMVASNVTGYALNGGFSGGSAGLDGTTVYNDGEIARSELRWSSEPPPSFPDYSGIEGSAGFGYFSPVDRSNDVLVAAAGRGLGVIPDSMESLRGPDGVYRVQMGGADTTPNVYGNSAGGDLPAQRVEVIGRRMTDAEKAAYDAQQFQEANDAQVTAGTYDRFRAIGAALSAGQYGNAWRHVTFEASGQARAVNNARLFPQPSPEMQRLDRMVASPIGTITSLAVRGFSGSQRAQDIALDVGAMGESAIGGAFGLPKTVGPAQSRLQLSSQAWRREPLPPEVFDPNGNQIPYGFGTYDEYAAFANTLQNGLPKDSLIAFKGSSVTGRSSRYSSMPLRPFDSGRKSDFDIAIVNEDLYLDALNIGRSAGFKVKTLPDRIGPLNDYQAELLGLRPLQKQLTNQAGRPVEFMLFDNRGGALEGSSHVVQYGVGQ
jgi:hypothetical protein